MKVALIIPGTIWFAPYVRIYTKILDEVGVEYQIISWNRDGKDGKEGIQYEVNINVNNGSASLSAYLGYVKFIKRSVKAGKFDKLIVFGPQMACLLGTFLLSKFRGRFIIDYRDLSIEQKLGFKQLFALLTKFSYANVISSPGFKCCLPKRNYLLSHNFDVTAVNAALGQCDKDNFGQSDKIDVLTIGGIRDYSSNVQVVDALANNSLFTVRFVGRGSAAQKLAEHCKKEGIHNVSFVGFYQKPEEADFIKTTDFMNIFYPRVITHDTALSNRFYNSLIHRKPMVVTKNTCQGDYAEKYNVGVALVDCSTLDKALNAFMQQDYKSYAKRCDELLREFLKDQKCFEQVVKKFVKNDV